MMLIPETKDKQIRSKYFKICQEVVNMPKYGNIDQNTPKVLPGNGSKRKKTSASTGPRVPQGKP